jgi:hypothetical protein
LQTQTIMERIVNANANDCQYQNRHLGMLQGQII